MLDRIDLRELDQIPQSFVEDDHRKVKIIHFIEIYSGLLRKRAQKNNRSKFIQDFIGADNLTYDNEVHSIYVDWPLDNSIIRLMFSFRFNEKFFIEYINILHHKINLIEFKLTNDKIYITTNYNRLYESGIKIKLIHDLIHFIREVFPLKYVNYTSSLDRTLFNYISIKNIKNHFNHSDFLSLIDINSGYNLLTRINNIFLLNSINSSRHKFALTWEDHFHHSYNLRVELDRSRSFTKPSSSREGLSWVFSEKTLLHHFPEYTEYRMQDNQRYYQLRVFESNSYKPSHMSMILNMWFTLDGLFGELRDLKKGKTMSGNQVIAVFHLFNQIFRIKNTFLCDISYLTDEKQNVEIPLRLIHSIATGKTWYQSKMPSLKLFDCDHFFTIGDGVINQNDLIRRQALQELQELPIKDLYRMLDSDARMYLSVLFKKYINNSLSMNPHYLNFITRSADNFFALIDSNITLMTLTSKIYQKSREEKKLTDDLVSLTNILTSGLSEDNSYENLKMDVWLKERVKIILYDSKFWVNIYDESVKLDFG